MPCNLLVEVVVVGRMHTVVEVVHIGRYIVVRCRRGVVARTGRSSLCRFYGTPLVLGLSQPAIVRKTYRNKDYI